MMERSFSERKRGSFIRKQKPLLLLITEGRNVTERQYFKQFQRQHLAFNIKVLTPGSATDPDRMRETLERYWKQYDLSYDRGDRGYVVLDLDCNDSKAKLIERLEKESEIAKFIVSNPCFEIWFLLHYRYSTHSYSDGREVIKDLRKYIPEYEKNTDVTEILTEKLEVAMDNAKKLVDYYEELRAPWPSNDCNPRTDVPEIIREIIQMAGEKANDNR